RSVPRQLKAGRIQSHYQTVAPPRSRPRTCRTVRLSSCRHAVTRHIVSASVPGDAPGTDGEVLVARYGGGAVTDAEREASAAQLREHYAAGRLSLDEFQDRLDAVYRAQTVRDLGMVTDSLPHEGVVIPPAGPWGGYRGGDPLDVAVMRTVLARAGRRIMLVFGVVTAGSLLVLTLLITAFMVHGGLLG